MRTPQAAPGWCRAGRMAIALLLWLAAGSQAAFCPLVFSHEQARGAAAVRSAKVAGQFYPGDREELAAVVGALLSQQPEPATPQKPRILIVPHAGYPYSGTVAAAGFRRAQGHAYDGVVVVAFTHRMQFDGPSVDSRAVYETPLGRLVVHQEAVARLLQQPGIGHHEPAHETNEHSLEVELPFLQVALGDVWIVPILMGGAGIEEARQLADALADLSRSGDYLFVFSTDLSHYHPYDEAVRIDDGTVNAILGETPQAVHRLFSAGLMEACGRGPILAGLLLAAKLGYPARELLLYANSGDTAGDPSSVVGYAAIAMYDRPEPSSARLSDAAGMALVAAARRTLERSLADQAGDPAAATSGADGASSLDSLRSLGTPSEPHRQAGRAEGSSLDRAQDTVLREVSQASLAQYPELSKAGGLFVTLRKDGELRGCIGRVEAEEPLAELVPVVALDAALRDTRFAPVTPAELPDLTVEVSVLTPPVRVDDPKDIVAGRDGVVLEHRGRSGVFLPQVWESTGWTRLEFLRELASQKAGLVPDAWQQAALFVFQDHTFEEPRR